MLASALLDGVLCLGNVGLGVGRFEGEHSGATECSVEQVNRHTVRRVGRPHLEGNSQPALPQVAAHKRVRARMVFIGL